jgi:hypothetical protein
MALAKVAFVGCGSHATNNIFPMLRYASCTLEAVCDLNEFWPGETRDISVLRPPIRSWIRCSPSENWREYLSSARPKCITK